MMGGEDSPPPAPAPVIIQQPQALTQTAQQAAQGQVDSFKQLIPLLPEYAQTMTDIQRDQAPQMSAINLQQQKEYGPQLIQAAMDNLKIADPTGLAARESLGKQVLSGLSSENFGQLSANEKRQAEQDVRAGQVARGGGTGMSDSIEEAINKYNLGNSRQQQQLSNVGSFLAGTPPQASFSSLNGAGQTAPVGTPNVGGFSASLFPSTNALISNQAQNYATNANFTSANNQLMNNQFQYKDQNTSNPFLTGMAAFGSFAAESAPKSISF